MAQTLSAQRRLLAVLCGGFIGTLIRYGLSMVIQAWLGTGWPYDILLINLTGACALALLTTLADAALLIGPTRRLLLTTGLLGAYTTFSSLALGDVLLFNKGAWLLALLYLILSLFGGIIMILLGDRLGQMLIARIHQRFAKAQTSPDLLPEHAWLYLMLSLFGSIGAVLLGKRLGQAFRMHIQQRLEEAKARQDLRQTHEHWQTPDDQRLPEQAETPHRHTP